MWSLIQEGGTVSVTLSPSCFVLVPQQFNLQIRELLKNINYYRRDIRKKGNIIQVLSTTFKVISKLKVQFKIILFVPGISLNLKHTENLKKIHCSGLYMQQFNILLYKNILLLNAKKIEIYGKAVKKRYL